MIGNGDIINTRHVSRDIFSATVGSILCCYTGQPLDTLKVRMQIKPTIYTTILEAAQKTIQEEGMHALWKGSVPTALGMAAENAMAFGLNETLKRAFPSDNSSSVGYGQHDKPELFRPFWMGLVTGLASAVVLLPSEVIKAKTQAVVGNDHSSSLDIYRKMLREQGWKSLFVGFDAQLMRDGPFYAVFFGGYELFCYTFRTHVPQMPQEMNYFLSGGLAGMLGWTVAMPFDVPKTNIQSRWDTKVVGSYFLEMGRIVRERGVLGLYNGLWPTLVRAFPANAALFLGVEMGKKFFDDFLW
eukprot:CAMPEP_0176479314 /NCGR_PEP_ID=MMETSP0200_2-20121128/1673_1 /TAXON_ID=947934 /ORGANISM="Chaetoceros sp., Strain GSL56" /LENGTH=298 /DNA_ID=CAMNT_0017875349 /DNA_START=125 /DNA_END=1018 /DNA_ORIENTATION=-